MITSCLIMSSGLSLVAGVNRNIQTLNLSRWVWCSMVLLSQYIQNWGIILVSWNHFEREACPSGHRLNLFMACLLQAVIYFLILCFYHSINKIIFWNRFSHEITSWVWKSKFVKILTNVYFVFYSFFINIVHWFM